jgi:predicted NUDIX family NTP pyrophosphohydrolase
LTGRIIIGLLILVELPAIAQTTLPSTQPAAVDQSTPKGALKVFFRAEASSDGNALLTILLAENPAQKHMIAAMADKKNADRDLTAALSKQFPAQWPSDPRQTAMKDLPGIFDQIDLSEQTVGHDTAQVKAQNADSPPFTVRRVDGQWRIPLAVIMPTDDPAKLETDARQIEIQVGVMRQAAGDVAAGKYSTFDQAVQDIKQRMFTAALEDHDASKTATAPVTGP